MIIVDVKGAVSLFHCSIKGTRDSMDNYSSASMQGLYNCDVLLNPSQGVLGRM